MTQYLKKNYLRVITWLKKSQYIKVTLQSLTQSMNHLIIHYFPTCSHCGLINSPFPYFSHSLLWRCYLYLPLLVYIQDMKFNLKISNSSLKGFHVFASISTFYVAFFAYAIFWPLSGKLIWYYILFFVRKLEKFKLLHKVCSFLSVFREQKVLRGSLKANTGYVGSFSIHTIIDEFGLSRVFILADPKWVWFEVLWIKIFC